MGNKKYIELYIDAAMTIETIYKESKKRGAIPEDYTLGMMTEMLFVDWANANMAQPQPAKKKETFVETKPDPKDIL